MGGYAVGIHGHPRYTGDLDIWLNPNPENAEKILQAVNQFGFTSFKLSKEDFIKPSVHPDHSDVYHIFNVRHPKRDLLRDYLLNEKIGTEIHYPVPPHHQKAFAEIFGAQSFPVSEEIHRTTLSLPCSLCHSEEDIYKVIEAMNKF